MIKVMKNELDEYLSEYTKVGTCRVIIKSDYYGREGVEEHIKSSRRASCMHPPA